VSVGKLFKSVLGLRELKSFTPAVYLSITVLIGLQTGKVSE